MVAVLVSIGSAVGLLGGMKPAAAAVSGITVPAGFDSEVFYGGDQLSAPAELLFDPSGNLLVSDQGPFNDCATANGKVVSISPTGSASVLASGSELQDADGMAFGPGGAWDTSLYISDHNAGGGCAGWFFKFGSGGLSPFSTPGAPWGASDPHGLAFGPGGSFGTDLYVADFNGGFPDDGQFGGVYRIEPAGNKTVVYHGGEILSPHEATFRSGGAFGSGLHVTDHGNGPGGTGYIWRLDSSGAPTLFAGGSGTPFVDPISMAFGPGGAFGNDIYVTDVGAHAIHRVDASGQVSTFASGLTRGPAGIAFGPTGKDLYTSSGNSTIRIFPTALADTTKPTITLNAPTDGATYTQGQSVNADYSCSDDTSSGSDLSCTGTVPSGSSVGTKTFEVKATDKAGNTDTKSVSYTVVAPCTFGEILPPVNDVSSATDPGMSAYKYGSRGVIPAKFQVSCDDNPIDTQAEADAHPMKLKLTKLGSTPEQDAVIESTETGSANTGDYFRFSGAPDNFYIYNIGVKNLAKGTYKITISEANGRGSHNEWFSIK